jgi:hypothetical protein
MPMFGVPLAFSYFLAASLASAAHRRLATRWGIFTLASMAVVMAEREMLVGLLLIGRSETPCGEVSGG